MNALRISFLALGLTLPTVAAADKGQELHDGNCLSCHDAGVYQRAERRVTTLEGLHKQVRRCELALGLNWFDEDIDAVSKHLNASYYKF